MFRVIVVGGNSTNDFEFFRTKCINILRNKANEGIMIYTTGDEFVRKFAQMYRIDLKIFTAEFKKDGKNALSVRNNKMLEDCDAVICFDNGTREIKYIHDMACERHIPARLIHYN